MSKNQAHTKQPAEQPPVKPITKQQEQETPAPDMTGSPFTQPFKPIKSVTFKKSYTPAVVAMAHVGQLLIEAKSEMYKYKLPVKGRTETLQDATVIDAVNLETGEFIMLICNETMKQGFERSGPPITGRTFGLKSHDMSADKAYRMVEVIEVDVERE
jgi:hypothetical protein